MLAAGIILLTAAITVARIDNSVDHVRLTLGEVESLVSCEVMKMVKLFSDAMEKKTAAEKI